MCFVVEFWPGGVSAWINQIPLLHDFWVLFLFGPLALVSPLTRALIPPDSQALCSDTLGTSLRTWCFCPPPKDPDVRTFNLSVLIGVFLSPPLFARCHFSWSLSKCLLLLQRSAPATAYPNLGWGLRVCQHCRNWEHLGLRKRFLKEDRD